MDLLRSAWKTPYPPNTLHPTRYTLHHIPYTLHPTPCTLHITPYNLHPTPYTLHHANPQTPKQRMSVGREAARNRGGGAEQQGDSHENRDTGGYMLDSGPKIDRSQALPCLLNA